MVIEKYVSATLGAVFAAGVVACAAVRKAVQNKKPQVIEGLETLEKKVGEIKEKTAKTLKTARDAFREGYSQG